MTRFIMNMSASSLKVEYAVKTKLSQDKLDYRILRSSSGVGLLEERDFEIIFRYFSVGNVPSKSRKGFLATFNYDPKSGVWLTVGQFKDYLVIIRQGNTQFEDNQGRTIAFSCCFCVRISDMLSHGINWINIISRLPELEDINITTHQRSAPIILYITPDIHVLRATFEDYGFNLIAAITSSISKHHICITGFQDLTQENRIYILGAALSLLPYPFRFRVSVSTWADSAVEHNIRLCFTNACRKNYKKLIWNQKYLEENVIDEEAYEMLNELREYYGLEKLLLLLNSNAVLSNQLNETESDLLDLPDALRRIFQSYYAWKDIKNGRGNTEVIRDILSEGQKNRFGEFDLDESNINDIVRFLISVPEGDNIRVLERFPRAVATIIQDSSFIRSQLLDNKVGKASYLYNIAISVGQGESFLRHLREYINNDLSQDGIELIDIVFELYSQIKNLSRELEARYPILIKLVEVRESADYSKFNRDTYIDKLASVIAQAVENIDVKEKRFRQFVMKVTRLALPTGLEPTEFVPLAKILLKHMDQNNKHRYYIILQGVFEELDNKNAIVKEFNNDINFIQGLIKLLSSQISRQQNKFLD